MLAESVIQWTEEWKQQGIQEGIRQGRQEGRQEGEAMLLERLLIKRFGPLDEERRLRLHTASRDQLEGWAERMLDAQGLDEVFGDG